MKLDSCGLSRRKMLGVMGTAAAGTLLRPIVVRADDEPPPPTIELPTSPVAVARCAAYDGEVLNSLATMFDQLGGIRDLVADKTVAIKINMIGSWWGRVEENSPVELSHWTHPAVLRAAIQLFGEAGAARIRVLECSGAVTDPLENTLRDAGWDVDGLFSAAPNVEFENTTGLGYGENYSRIVCPAGGTIFPAYDVNHSYTDCDVFVSMPKMKEHKWFGVTLSMKNCYGMTPLTIYGDARGEEEPSTEALGTRVRVFHEGQRTPSLSAPQEIDPESPRVGDYRIPRIVADIVSARPVHLAIVDGIESMAGGEGPWAENARRVSPGLLVAGFNPVTTDAVTMALMGFNPMAERGEAPFEGSDSFLTFAEQLGLGTRDLSRIEVLGTSIEEGRLDFRSA